MGNLWRYKARPIVQKIVTVMVSIGLGIWGYVQYLKKNRLRNRVRELENRIEMLEEQ